MRLITYTLCLSIGMALTSCSSETIESKDVSEEQVFRSYQVTHDAGARSTFLNAQFRVGGVSGTTVRLTDPSHVTVSGAPLLLNDVNSSPTLITGTYYSSTHLVEAPDQSYSFTWFKRDGSQINDQISLAAPVYSTSLHSGDTIHRNQDLDIALDLSVDQDGDSVTAILLTNSDNGGRAEAVHLVTGTTTFGPTIHIPAADLQKIAVGEARVTLLHRTSRTLTRTRQGLGGSIESTYKTVPLLIKIVD